MILRSSFKSWDLARKFEDTLIPQAAVYEYKLFASSYSTAWNVLRKTETKRYTNIHTDPHKKKWHDELWNGEVEKEGGGMALTSLSLISFILMISLC